MQQWNLPLDTYDQGNQTSKSAYQSIRNKNPAGENKFMIRKHIELTRESTVYEQQTSEIFVPIILLGVMFLLIR